MDIRGKRLVVIGGAGLIGSHTVDQLILEDVVEIIVYDNFARGTPSNLESALKDPRVSVYDVDGDIRDTEILREALRGVHGVFHFAALWLLHCNEYPRSAFDVNVQGTFAGCCYNVGTGVATSLESLAEIILEITRTSLPIKYIQSDRPGLVRRRVGSTTLTTRHLDFTAEASLSTGLRELISWRSTERYSERISGGPKS